MGVGHAVSVASLELGIDEVIEDSRCPADVVCIWPGTARIRAWARASGQARREIELTTFPRLPLLVEGYSVEVEALEPFPYSNVRIDPRRYVATLVVRRL